MTLFASLGGRQAGCQLPAAWLLLGDGTMTLRDFGHNSFPLHRGLYRISANGPCLITFIFQIKINVMEWLKAIDFSPPLAKITLNDIL